jgi:hypothetical protein
MLLRVTPAFALPYHGFALDNLRIGPHAVSDWLNQARAV